MKWMKVSGEEVYGGEAAGETPFQRDSRLKETLGLNTLGSKEGSYDIELQLVLLRRKRQLGSCFDLPEEPVRLRRNTRCVVSEVEE